MLTTIERDDCLGWHRPDISQEFELDDRAHLVLFRRPTPDAFRRGLELRVPERSFQPAHVHGTAGDLEVNLNVDVGRSGMEEAARAAKQLRNQPAQEDEAGAFSIMVDDAHQRGFSRASRRRPPSLIPGRLTIWPCTHSTQSHSNLTSVGNFT